jgi:hypothetical protein
MPHPYQFRPIESGLIWRACPDWRIESIARCPCGRPAPENKDAVPLAFRCDDGAIGYFAPCSDPKCKGAESCRQEIRRLKQWRDEQSAGVGIHRHDALGRQYIGTEPHRDIRYNKRLTVRPNPILIARTRFWVSVRHQFFVHPISHLEEPIKKQLTH